VEARLEGTGYYLRYSGLDADDAVSLPSQPPRPGDAAIVQADRSRVNGMVPAEYYLKSTYTLTASIKRS
jgi:hypothetical protein